MKLFMWDLSTPLISSLNRDWTRPLRVSRGLWSRREDAVPSRDVLLKGVDDLSVLAQLADEALLSTQAAAEHVGAGEFDHLGQEGGQFPVDHLEEEGEWRRGVSDM